MLLVLSRDTSLETVNTVPLLNSCEIDALHVEVGRGRLST
jgi:hypothetical protein